MNRTARPHAQLDRALSALLLTARRFSARPDEAQDLLHDALCEAIAAGRSDFTRPEHQRWIVGVLRNLSKEAARGAVRRKRREQAWGTIQPDASEPRLDADASVNAVVATLRPPLKLVARLALAGHTREEIEFLLDIPATALRQRIVALKTRLQAAGLTAPSEFIALLHHLPYGPRRQELRVSLRLIEAHLGSHDPDGHLFLIGGTAPLTNQHSAATNRRASFSQKGNFK